MLVTGLLTFPQAVSPETIDYETLTLLFGMMVVVAYCVSRDCLMRIRTQSLIESAALGVCLC